MAGTVFIGSKRQGLVALQGLRAVEGDGLGLAITLDDSEDDRSVLPELRAYCQEAGVELVVADNRGHATDVLLAARPERCFVSGWYWLIDGPTLEAVPGGFIGVHNSLLPKYRGGAPVVWAIMNGEREVGASIFYLGEGMDEGDILGQLAVPVGPDDHVADVLARLEERVARELPGIWRGLLDGSLKPTAQDASQATYCGQRKPADGEIDWRQDARRIHDFVRAQSPPYPGAFVRRREREITLLETSVFDRPYHCTPGQVLLRTAEGTLVGCGGDTALLIETVRVDGEVLPAREVLKSVKTRLASR